MRSNGECKVIVLAPAPAALRDHPDLGYLEGQRLTPRPRPHLRSEAAAFIAGVIAGAAALGLVLALIQELVP